MFHKPVHAPACNNFHLLNTVRLYPLTRWRTSWHDPMKTFRIGCYSNQYQLLGSNFVRLPSNDSSTEPPLGSTKGCIEI